MSLTGSCFSPKSAPRPFHHGIRRRGGTIFTRPCRLTNGRFKRTCELTSSIVPRGTSFHRSVELEPPPIAFDLALSSCCRCELFWVHRKSVPSSQMRCIITANRRARATIAFSNRPLGVKRFQALHLLRCRCRSRARASLRNRHQGPSIMGSEDEVEQSLPRPCRQTNGRSKRTCELTSSIVPRGTSFHHWVELEYSPIAFDLALSSCCRCKLFSGPPEVGAV